MIIGLSRLIDIIVSLNRRFRQAQIEKKLKQRYVSVDPFSLYNNDITLWRKLYRISELVPILDYKDEPTLKSKACLKCLYFTIIIFDLCRYLEYFSYLCTIN